MITRFLKTCLILALLQIGFAIAPKTAEAKDIWQTSTSGSFVTLRYGPFDQQLRPLFMLSCLNGVDIAVLSVHLSFDEQEPGDAVTIEFSADGETTPVAGETAAEDGTGIIYAEAGDIAVKPILKILERKGPVTMKSGASSLELPETGRAISVAEFSKDCSLD